MKVLVIGSGAREHALIWKIAQSNKVTKIFAAPGNGGIADLAECVNIGDGDIEELVKFAYNENIELTVVGTENPLVAGIVDIFNKQGLRIFGPDKVCANLEGSKAFAKDFMRKYDIPTAAYKNCSNVNEAIKELDNVEYPIVIKADGLAAGKGVIISQTKEEAKKTVNSIMKNSKFGSAGETVVIEEFLTGTEASLLCFVDNNTIFPMESARDYKKAYDNDEGLNTGGMGCFSPNPIFTPELDNIIKEKVLDKITIGLNKENMNFKGVLFIGFMVKDKDIKVLEFNVRFGDPETEVVLPRLKSDIVDIFDSVIDGKMTADLLKWSDKASHCVIAASGGYPEGYEKGKEINGIENTDKEVMIFHGGTKKVGDKILTNGGRVLAVTSLGKTPEEAKEKSYRNIAKINFDKMFYRKDIGQL